MAKVRFGMVGGGPEAFIGKVHRMAAALDGGLELVCGAFSRDPEKSAAAGRELGLPEARVYDSYAAMFEAESALPPEARMAFVSIVTPNNLHYPVAAEAIARGFHVFCEKPATLDLASCQRLACLVKTHQRLFGLAHTYAGYPLVHEARELVRHGEIGDVVKVVVEYSQDWLAAARVDAQNKQALWRLDPEQAGATCCIGDIGVHAAHLSEFITGVPISQVLADLASVVPGRKLDDDGQVLLRFTGGARGVLVASQISHGEDNNLNIRVYGTQGSLGWCQQTPNELRFTRDGNTQVLRRGVNTLSPAAQSLCRIPVGHPEGYLEAFANHYHIFARAVQTAGNEQGECHLISGIHDALRGMAFIDAASRSHGQGNVWVNIPTLDQLTQG